MFIAALFAVAKRSIDRQMDKQNMVYMYTGILCSLKMKEILLNATKWMKLEDINE